KSTGRLCATMIRRRIQRRRIRRSRRPSRKFNRKNLRPDFNCMYSNNPVSPVVVTVHAIANRSNPPTVLAKKPNKKIKLSPHRMARGLTPLYSRQSAVDSFTEYFGARQKAQNEKSFAREIKEVSWVNQHVVLFQQRQRPLLFRELARQF